MTDQASELPKNQAQAVDVIAITPPRHNSNTSSSKPNVRPHHWTPTLRGVSLLNTLLFLGLALSHTKLQAHAATAASSESGYAASLTATTTHKEASPGVQVETSPTKLSLPELDDDDEVKVELEVDLEDPSEEFDTDFGSESPSDDDEEEEHKPHKRKDFIVVAAVDGTLAAVEKVTGKVLWKKDGNGSAAGYRTSDHHQEDGMKLPRGDNNNNNNQRATIQGEYKLLQPLVATTTTVSSTKTMRTKQQDASRTAAIPSIDGNVFITTAEGASVHENSVSRTDTASVRELVARAPYVDSSGRFYVGSRRSMVAALDSATGEILYVASADVDDEEEGAKRSDPDWEGRDVIWIGRVDYVVSVYNAKSSAKEVQFSASEIMSVNDMVAGKGKVSKPSMFHRPNNPNAMIGSSSEEEEDGSSWDGQGEEAFRNGPSFDNDDDDDDQDSVLVATPSGNLAYRSGNTERVEWVSDLAFETPIAYAIHTTSGQSLAVDIIPDVTNPANSKEEYLRDEIERQIELTLQDSRRPPPLMDHAGQTTLDRPLCVPSIEGTLLNGQLYSMPLGRQTTALPSHVSLATTRTQAEHVLLDAAGDHHHHHHQTTASSTTGRESQGLAKWIMPVADSSRISTSSAHQDERQFVGPNGICPPSATSFPGCLFKAASQRTLDFFPRKDKAITGDNAHGPSDEGFKASQEGALETYNVQQEGIEAPYHQHGQQQGSQQQRKRKRNYRILKILGSWLPPTIALIFVVSFELGRRKRQKDSLDNKLVDGNEIISSVGQKDGSSGGHVIQITDQLLGLGSNGTQVFRGTLDGRQVAVKRILKTYVASADREISLLIESDGHPNVVRYFLKEVKGDFVYLALELCDLSLHSLIGTLDAVMKDGGIASLTEGVDSPTKRILMQIACGVRHLHSLRIVHNDLKPANILLAITKEGKASESSDSASNDSIFNNFEMGFYIAKISDMGLGKMLVGQSSFGGCPSSVRGQSSSLAANGNVGIGPGTVGWMAPEAMRIKSSASIASEESCDSTPSDGLAPSSGARASRSVDIFSLGCIFYSTLVPGSHPFGEWYEREANIMHNRPNIESLQSLSVEAYNLVGAMIQYNPRVRPTSDQVVQHPYFWAHAQRLSFICDLSDRLETDSNGEKVSSGFSSNPLAIERNAIQVVGLAWDKSLHNGLAEQKYRTYDPSSVRDLLRLIRNKKNHYQDLDVSLRQLIGSSTDGLMAYFESCFPHLLMHCYKVCCEVLDLNDPLVDKYSLSSANYPKHRNIREPKRMPQLLSGSLPPQAITEVKSPEQEISVGTPMDDEVVSHGEELEDFELLPYGEEKKDPASTTDAPDEHPPTPSVQVCPLCGSVLGPSVDGKVLRCDKCKCRLESTESTEDTKNEVTSAGELQAVAVVDTKAEELDDLDSLDCREKKETANIIDVPDEHLPTSSVKPPVPVESTEDTENAKEVAPAADPQASAVDGIVLWQGSTAARTLNCRGWMRSDEDWTGRSAGTKKRNGNLTRCAQDPKFRTRLCNHWDTSLGTMCPMRKKGKCVFAHGPAELRIKEGKKNRWGKLVDKNGNNSNPKHSGGEDTYGAARSIESTRKDEGKWSGAKGTNGKKNPPKKKAKGPAK